MTESRDRLMDALLMQHLRDTPLRMESRYARAFARLDAAQLASERRDARGQALRIARAALIALFAGTMLLLIPIESSASTVLASAASRASSDAGERRYEVELRFMRPAPAGEREITLRGNWDMRGSESRLELFIAGLPGLVRADSSDGAWERRGDGPARSLESRELWPRWIEERDGRVAVERMDDLLHLVQRAYQVAFARAGDESPAALRGAMHLVASRRARAPGPDEIDLWIDTERSVVLEARLRWNRGPRDGAPPRPPHDRPPPMQRPPADEDYRAAPGALPPMPPDELRLRRVEPIGFPADHFKKPA